jgi:hypothetical protein
VPETVMANLVKRGSARFDLTLARQGVALLVIEPAK